MSQSTYPLKAPARPNKVARPEAKTPERKRARKRVTRSDIAGALFSLGLCGFLLSLVMYFTARETMERPFVASVSIILMALSNAFLDTETKPQIWRRP